MSESDQRSVSENPVAFRPGSPHSPAAIALCNFYPRQIHCTTSVKFSACVVAPALAVTTIVYVPAAVPPPPPLDDPPPHPAHPSAINSAPAHISRTTIARLRREPNHTHASIALIANSQIHPFPPPGALPPGPNFAGPPTTLRAVVVTLTVTASDPFVLKFAEEGFTLQFAPAGAPEHESETLPLNPPTDASDKL